MFVNDYDEVGRLLKRAGIQPYHEYAGEDGLVVRDAEENEAWVYPDGDGGVNVMFFLGPQKTEGPLDKIWDHATGSKFGATPEETVNMILSWHS